MYDWPAIKVRYEMGQTAYQISKQLGGKPSKQGIEKRAKKEGWQKPEAPAQLPVVTAALNVPSEQCTPETVGIILTLISEGATQDIAAQAAGISDRTWRNWKNAEPALSEAVRRARAGKVMDWQMTVSQTAKTDWKAAQWLLQTAPETREHFATQKDGSKVSVTFNINRDEVVIEGQASEA